MSLPKYKSWKNKHLYTEMQAGSASPPQPYIPSTERNLVGNQQRTPEPTHKIEFSREHDTAPSSQSGGPVRSDTNGWYQDILSKFQDDLKKPTPERTTSLGDMGMKGVSNATFGKSGDVTQLGGTPLISGGIPVTDMKGQFDWNMNEESGEPIGINPAEQPEDPNLPGQAMTHAQRLIKSLHGKTPMVIQQVKTYISQELFKMQQEKGNAAKFARQDIVNARGMNKPQQ